MKIIKRLAFVLGMLVSVGMCEVIEGNKIKDFCGDSGISKCISFYESSCNSGNFWACEMLDRLNMSDFDEAVINKNNDMKFGEFICQSYNGSTADIEKIILNLIKYAKEIGKFLAENNVAKTSSAMQEMARIVAQEESIITETKAPKWQTDFKQTILEACEKIGYDYIYGGDEISKDITKGTAYLKKSCDYGYYVACYKLGNIYFSSTFDKGLKHLKNLSLAKKYYEKACDLGDKYSCDNYIELHQKGVK